MHIRNIFRNLYFARYEICKTNIPFNTVTIQQQAWTNVLTCYKPRPNQCKQNHHQTGEINMYNILFTFSRSLHIYFSITKMYVHGHSCFLLCTNYYIHRCMHSASSNCLSGFFGFTYWLKAKKTQNWEILYFCFGLFCLSRLFILSKQHYSFFLIKLSFIIFWFVRLHE